MANAKVSHPPQREASLRLPCINCSISLGMTGIMMPKPMVSTSNVMKIKPSAAFLDEGMEDLKFEI